MSLDSIAELRTTYGLMSEMLTKILKEEECGVQKDETRVTRSIKEKYELEVKNGRNDESQIMRTLNKDDDRGNGKKKDNGHEDVVGNGLWYLE